LNAKSILLKAMHKIMEDQVEQKLTWLDFIFYYKSAHHFEAVRKETVNDPIKAPIVLKYINLVRQKVISILGTIPRESHWMLPAADFPKKNQTMQNFMSSDKEELRLADSKKTNRVGLCKVAALYELTTNIKDIEEDARKFKTVILRKKYNNIAYHQRNVKIVREFCFNFKIPPPQPTLLFSTETKPAMALSETIRQNQMKFERELGAIAQKTRQIPVTGSGEKRAAAISDTSSTSGNETMSQVAAPKPKKLKKSGKLTIVNNE